MVELFTGPGGSLDGYRGGPPGQLLPPDPINLPIVPALTSVTTAAPTALNPPEHYTGNGGEDLWEYAAAPFSFDLPAGAIADGNEVALRLGSHEAIMTLAAITCAAPSVTINQAVGQADPTSTGPIHFTAVFNEAVSGFATGDVESERNRRCNDGGRVRERPEQRHDLRCGGQRDDHERDGDRLPPGWRRNQRRRHRQHRFDQYRQHR